MHDIMYSHVQMSGNVIVQGIVNYIYELNKTEKKLSKFSTIIYKCIFLLIQ